MRGSCGDASDGLRDLTAPRGRGFHRHRAAITAGTFDVLGTLHGFVAILAMAESAHPAGGHHLQVLPDASNARETIHSSYEPTPRTRSNLPRALPGSDSRFVSHRYAQAAATPMAAVGGAARPFGRQPAAQARQARPGRLCGRSHALFAGSRRPGSDQGASLTSEAPWGGGFDMRAARVYDPYGLC